MDENLHHFRCCFSKHRDHPPAPPKGSMLCEGAPCRLDKTSHRLKVRHPPVDWTKQRTSLASETFNVLPTLNLWGVRGGRRKATKEWTSSGANFRPSTVEDVAKHEPFPTCSSFLAHLFSQIFVLHFVCVLPCFSILFSHIFVFHFVCVLPCFSILSSMTNHGFSVGVFVIFMDHQRLKSFNSIGSQEFSWCPTVETPLTATCHNSDPRFSGI